MLDFFVLLFLFNLKSAVLIVIKMTAPSPLFFLLNKIYNDLEVARPLSGSSSTSFLVESEFGSVGFF